MSAIQQRAFRAKKVDEMAADPRHPMHGTAAGYTYGCRCARCRAAGRAERERLAVQRKVKAADPSWSGHGTTTGYTYGCRCARCRAAFSAYKERHAAEVLAKMEADPSEPHHGRQSGYRYGCRCDRCRAANRKGK